MEGDIGEGKRTVKNDKKRAPRTEKKKGGGSSKRGTTLLYEKKKEKTEAQKKQVGEASKTGGVGKKKKKKKTRGKRRGEKITTNPRSKHAEGGANPETGKKTGAKRKEGGTTGGPGRGKKNKPKRETIMKRNNSRWVETKRDVGPRPTQNWERRRSIKLRGRLGKDHLEEIMGKREERGLEEKNEKPGKGEGRAGSVHLLASDNRLNTGESQT